MRFNAKNKFLMFPKEMESWKGKPVEDGLAVFFEKELAQIREQTLLSMITNIIRRNLTTKYGQDGVSARLLKKLNEINYYPALEDIQEAIFTTPTLDTFKRKVTKIVNSYKDEIQGANR